MTRRGRNLKELSRRRPRLTPRKCVLIVCEGQKTEPNYFKALRTRLKVTTAEVEVIGQGAAPVTLVQEAVKRKKARKKAAKAGAVCDYDCIWCVFDVERSGQIPSLPNALTQAKDNRIKVALSNPCFEYWYLLHFVHAASPLHDASETVRELKRHLRKYEKADAEVFGVLWPFTGEATQRARKVMEAHKGAGTKRAERNPSTEVHELVELLQGIVAGKS